MRIGLKNVGKTFLGTNNYIIATDAMKIWLLTWKVILFLVLLEKKVCNAYELYRNAWNKKYPYSGKVITWSLKQTW